jgi:hypothetical protein
MIKWKSCIEQRYDFEFWIYDDKKNKIIKLEIFIILLIFQILMY